MYNERWMYGPIYEVASARGWKIRTELPIKIDGHQRYVDFVFYGRGKKFDKADRLAALEVSFIREFSRKEKIATDQRKLTKVRAQDAQEGDFGPLKRYIMVASQGKDLETYCKANLPRAVPLVKGSKTDFFKQGVGWVFRSPVNFSRRWSVMVLLVEDPR